MKSESETANVAEDVALLLRLEVGEDEVLAVDFFAGEAALLEHVGGGCVLGMADCLEALDSGLPRDVDHGLQSFSGIAQAPGILCKNIAGDGAGWGSCRRGRCFPQAIRRRRCLA